MTIEELKEHCERTVKNCEWWAHTRGEEPNGNIYEEHKLILELLEDAISRKAVLDAITEIDDNTNMDIYTNEVREIISALSPVMPTRKVAHWILLDNCSNSGYYCSECHKKVVKEGWSDTVKKIKYCPNCGSFMMKSEQLLNYADQETMMPAT